MPAVDVDLFAHPPRGARVEAGGLVFLPRTIDKVRAKIAGTLGPYKVSPGLSAYFFEWLGVTEDEFTEAVRRCADDDGVIAWLRERSDPAGYAAINEQLFARGFRDEAHRAQMLPTYPVLRVFPALTKWFDIFDEDDRWMYRRAAVYGGMHVRFVAFSRADRVVRPGVLLDGFVRPFPPKITSLLDFIACSETDRERAIAELGEPIDFAQVTLHAPLGTRRTVSRPIHDGVDGESPLAFSTVTALAIVDADGDLDGASSTTEYTCEPELAVVIGARSHDVAEVDALESVFGYTCCNVVTARDRPEDVCTIGPWIVPACAIGDPQSLDVSLAIDGVIKRSGSTRRMKFPVTKIISDLSRRTTLEPGDAIATGPCAGIEPALIPDESYRERSVVEVGIEKIGILRNRFALRLPAQS